MNFIVAIFEPDGGPRRDDAEGGFEAQLFLDNRHFSRGRFGRPISLGLKINHGARGRRRIDQDFSFKRPAILIGPGGRAERPWSQEHHGQS
jgi:hypothetical protein